MFYVSQHTTNDACKTRASRIWLLQTQQLLRNIEERGCNSADDTVGPTLSLSLWQDDVTELGLDTQYIVHKGIYT